MQVVHPIIALKKEGVSMTNNCGNCKDGKYSGGQQQLADARKVRVETLCYVYCTHASVRDHVDKSAAYTCSYFDEKAVAIESPNDVRATKQT